MTRCVRRGNRLPTVAQGTKHLSNVARRTLGALAPSISVGRAIAGFEDSRFREIKLRHIYTAPYSYDDISQILK